MNLTAVNFQYLFNDKIMINKIIKGLVYPPSSELNSR
jgi:hypothetical protein